MELRVGYLASISFFFLGLADTVTVLPPLLLNQVLSYNLPTGSGFVAGALVGARMG